MRLIGWVLPLIGSLMIGCQGNSKPDSEKGLADIRDTKVMQYAIEGKTIYEKLCANCHGNDGKGLGRLIPPINGADYFKEDIGRTVRIIKNGQEGSIRVNGVEYNGVMPANPKLTTIEIAKLTTYLYNIWGESRGVISPSTIEEYLNEKGSF
jgi:cytochrome c551